MARRNYRDRKETKSLTEQNNLKLTKIDPMTENQEKAFNFYDDGYNLCLHGVPGSGKSFISLYLALEEVMGNKSSYEKVVIVRSAQASKAMGFLPGTAKQKMEVFETPYISICSKLFGRGDAYSILKQKNILEFESTSFLRGTTIDNAIIIVDEIQNLNFQEQRTILTRVGDNSKIILCGDLYQDDLTSERYNEESGLKKMLPILKRIASIKMVDFDVEDIVRSGFCREFILAELNIKELDG